MTYVLHTFSTISFFHEGKLGSVEKKIRFIYMVKSLPTLYSTYMYACKRTEEKNEQT